MSEDMCEDTLPSSGCETLQLFEDTHGVSCCLDHISLRQHALGKRLEENTHAHFSKISEVI